MMKLTALACATALMFAFGGAAMADDDDDDDRDRRSKQVEHRYVLIEGGDGFCEFERRDRDVWARIWVTGADNNAFVTAWTILGANPAVRFGGTVATGSGDAELSGHFKIKKRGTTDVKLDARGHISTIFTVNDDDELTTELTTPNGLESTGASALLGTCSTTFKSRKRRHR